MSTRFNKIILLVAAGLLACANVRAFDYIESIDAATAAKWSETLGAEGGFKVKDNNNDIPAAAGFSGSPCFEVWRNGNDLNGSITRKTIKGIPNGTYTLSFEYLAVKQNGTNDPMGVYFNVNGNTNDRITSFGTNSGGTSDPGWRRGIYSRNITITDGQLNFSIVFETANFNWFLIRDFRLTDGTTPTTRTFEHYEGWVYDEGLSNIPDELKYDGDYWQTSEEDNRINAGVKYQRTHEVVKTIWCFPGQSAELTPFTDFAYTDRYRQNYIRWVDYPTGTATGKLTFPGQTMYQFPTQDAGFFGGQVMAGDRNYGTHATYTSTDATTTTTDTLGVIAVEAATQFSYDEVSIAMGKVLEPTLMFRTIFVIRNARKRADEMMADNDDYVAANRIKLMAPANTPFQYHLPSPEGRVNASTPVNTINNTNSVWTPNGSANNDVKNKDNDGDIPDISIIKSPCLEVWNNVALTNGSKTTTLTGIAPGEYIVSIDAVAIQQSDNNAAPTGVTFTANGNSVSLSEGTTVSYGNNRKLVQGTYNIPVTVGADGNVNFNITVDGANFNWLLFKNLAVYPLHSPTGYWYKDGSDYKQVYHYRIVTSKLNASGTYDELGETTNVGGDKSIIDANSKLAYAYKTIENDPDKTDQMIYIQDPDPGNYIIEIYSLEDADLKLMEYELEIMNPKEGNMITQTVLATDPYRHQRPEEMEAMYGVPTTVVNFDDVTASQISDYTNNSVTGQYHTYPLQWEMSSYGFTYDKPVNDYITGVFDYNAYQIANNFNIVAYANAALDTNNGRTANAHDRLYEETEGEKTGYFYYVNAASDPGRMAILDIGKNFCAGTRVFVSAWVMEANWNDETANVVFSFKGVGADGSETTLNSFVTGYVKGGKNTNPGSSANSHFTPSSGVDNRGEWMHVYYNFYPDVPAGMTFDHYIISLENNATSSQGADYAIDDIRAFVCKPNLTAMQRKPVCNGSMTTELDLSTDFDRLLSSLGEKELTGTDSKNVTFYYSFIDSLAFEKEYLRQKSKTPAVTDDAALDSAYAVAVVSNAYNIKNNNYGSLTFNTNYSKNYEKSTLPTGKERSLPWREVVNESRMLYFPNDSLVNDGNFRVQTTYWIVMAEDDDNNSSNKLAVPYLSFNPYDHCARISSFKVVFSGEVKIDGILDSELNGADICANQKPAITVDLNGISTSGDSVFTATNASFDWYLGSEEEYQAAVDDQGQSLSASIVQFRTKYKDATQVQFSSKDPSGGYTAEMKYCIDYFLKKRKIKLYEKTGVVSLMEQYSDQIQPGEQRDYYITAIPIDPQIENVRFCLDPFQVTIHLSTRAPIMKDGDDHSGNKIPYPAAMVDVPLRTGLNQLLKCSSLTVNDETKIIGGLDDDTHTLYVPLREITPVTSGIRRLQKTVSDDYVYLISSDDPNVELSDSLSGVLQLYDGDTLDIKAVGRVKSVVALKGNEGNVAQIAFLNRFKFREGYSYTMKFHFEETTMDAETEGITIGLDVCPGDVIMTVKVVPEYQMWTGAVSRNWNDDRNWRRVSRAELFNPLETDVANEFVTDGGVNDTIKSFVPADFTKVIIPPSDSLINVPFMYDLRGSSNVMKVKFTGVNDSTLFIKDMTMNIPSSVLTVPRDTFPNTETGENEYADISIDMSAVVVDDDLACRPWLDHTCEQIHFMSGAEIMDQRYLYYQKAWVDIEMDTCRWQTVSNPLMNIVAGDYYLPTDGARQDTPLFQDITYDTSKNDRFKPAVYQRSWNAGNARVYKLDGNVENSAVALEWSNVYNDVNVDYNAGVGVSVKPDVYMLPKAIRPAKVKFRFPKADVSYIYYSPGNTNGTIRKEDVKSDALVNGKRTGKLIDVTSGYSKPVGGGTNTGTQYFLVGNPFMCHIDMRKFLLNEENAKYISPKYWTVTPGGQRVAVMTENSDGMVVISSTDSDPVLLAPGMSFFVSLKSGTATSFTPKFTSDMMTVVEKDTISNGGGNGGSGGGMISARNGLLGVSATDAYGHDTRMIFVDSVLYQTAGAEALFDSNLSDEPMIYTTMNGQAMSIAQMSKGNVMPIGLSGVKDYVEVHITGVSGCATPLCLMDAVTGQTMSLTSDTTFVQEESGVRYYIVAGPQDEKGLSASSMPVITCQDTRVTIDAPADAQLDVVRISDISGNCVASATDAGSQYVALLEKAVYVISLKCGDSEYTYKISLY